LDKWKKQGGTKMKIGIVGAGLVGATSAYAMVLRGVGREIVLVDLNRARAQAEADDILHAVPFGHPMKVRAGDYPDLANCRVVVIAAGVNQRPGESRLHLLSRNADVMRVIVPNILKYAPEAILIVATNPVDVITHLVAHFARQQGVSEQRVLGTGTTLDTARFRTLLGRYLGVDSQHIHGYVVGEHGDSEVLTWSLATVGGIPLTDYCDFTHYEMYEKMVREIDEQVRMAAYHIIEGKGATYYGIGGAVARIAEIVLREQRSIMTVTTPMPEVAGIKDVTVAMPFLVGGTGVLNALPLPLNDKEKELLNQSARIVRDAIDELEAEGIA
jgi:L-lactate dehydrogenase